MNRRGLLWIVLGVVWAAVSFWPWSLRSLVTRTLRPQVDASRPPGRLAPAEARAVLAFAEVLVAEQAFGSAERALLAVHLDDRTLGTPGFLSLYRGTAALLDRLGPPPFGDLPFGERLALVERLHLTDAPVGILDYLRPGARSALLTRQYVVPDLIAAYYASPAGWAVVGYDTSLGQCGDLARYTREEH